MATAHAGPRLSGLVNRVIAGVVGGLAGGVVFGVLMQMMGMIGMVAMLVGSDSVAIGWLVHLVIAAGIGAGFGLLLGGWPPVRRARSRSAPGMASCGGSSAPC
jgi:hypothetical protein